MLRRRPRDQEVAEPSVRVNQRVRAPEVRLIGADGAMVGVMSSSEAYSKALASGLDLVEVNPKAVPPVCRLMDFGKFKYEQKKKAADARKRQTVIEIKEIKFRPKTDNHDYDFKMRHIRRFLGDGDKVKVTIRFRGREIAHPQVAKRLLDRIVAAVKDEASVEQESRMEGRTMFLLIGPKAGGGAAAAPKPAPAKPAAPAPPGPGMGGATVVTRIPVRQAEIGGAAEPPHADEPDVAVDPGDIDDGDDDDEVDDGADDDST